MPTCAIPKKAGQTFVVTSRIGRGVKDSNIGSYSIRQAGCPPLQQSAQFSTRDPQTPCPHFSQALQRAGDETGGGQSTAYPVPGLPGVRCYRAGSRDGISQMADPAIHGLVSRRRFTAERRSKSACVRRQTGRSSPPPEENRDTGGKKRQKICYANRMYQRVRTATWLVRRR